MSSISFRNMIVSILLIGLVFVCLVNWSIQFTTDNNANNSLLEDDSIAFAFHNITYELNQSEKTAQGARNASETEVPQIGAESIIMRTTVAAGKTLTSTFVNILNLLFIVTSRKLGIHPVVFSTIIAILIISMVLLAWRVYRSGS